MKRRTCGRVTKNWRRSVMRVKRGKSGPTAEVATPKLARKACCGMMKHYASDALQAILVKKGMNVTLKGQYDSPAVSTLEAWAGPQVILPMKETLCLARVEAIGTVTGWSLCRPAVGMMRSGGTQFPRILSIAAKSSYVPPLRNFVSKDSTYPPPPPRNHTHARRKPQDVTLGGPAADVNPGNRIHSRSPSLLASTLFTPAPSNSPTCMLSCPKRSRRDVTSSERVHSPTPLSPKLPHFQPLSFQPHLWPHLRVVATCGPADDINPSKRVHSHRRAVPAVSAAAACRAVLLGGAEPPELTPIVETPTAANGRIGCTVPFCAVVPGCLSKPWSLRPCMPHMGGQAFRLQVPLRRAIAFCSVMPCCPSKARLLEPRLGQAPGCSSKPRSLRPRLGQPRSFQVPGPHGFWFPGCAGGQGFRLWVPADRVSVSLWVSRQGFRFWVPRADRVSGFGMHGQTESFPQKHLPRYRQTGAAKAEPEKHM
eukprot:34838-Chlamydomonas_euryale.AAC.2